MYNVMKAQKYQLLHDNFTYIVFFCGIVFLWIMFIMTGESGMGVSQLKGSGMWADGGMTVIPMYLMLIYTTRICGDDLKDKTVNYEVLTGNKKSCSYFGRLIVSLIVGVIVYLLFTVLPIIIVTAVFGWGHTLPLSEAVIRMALDFIPIMRLICLFAMLTFVTRSPLGAIALGFVAVLVESLITLMEDLLPIGIDKLAPFLAQGSSVVVETYNMKLDYIDGENVEVLKDAMPGGTICMIVVSGLLVCLLLSAVGCAVFNRQDMD